MTEPGLRERKKARTRRQIQETALRLIVAHGYDATTVERIAEESEVSVSTFFRYFPTKEDVVFQDDYDPILLARLEAEDPAEGPVQAFRAVARRTFGEIYANDREVLWQRVSLVFRVPALRARVLTGTQDAGAVFGATIAARMGLAPDDVQVRIAMAAIMSVIIVVMEDWVAGDGAGDLPTMVDDALGLLQNGFGSPA